MKEKRRRKSVPIAQRCHIITTAKADYKNAVTSGSFSFSIQSTFSTLEAEISFNNIIK